MHVVMNSLRRFRKPLAVLLFAALLAVAYPSLPVAGGCDEPGYTGGGCNRTHSGATGQIGPAPGPRGRDREPARIWMIELRQWLLRFLSGTVR